MMKLVATVLAGAFLVRHCYLGLNLLFFNLLLHVRETLCTVMGL
jgi:hypothetical protein